jgi:ketosteroid isomerase-like protein
MIGPEQAKSESAVLLANASFYRAFSEGDAAAMLELWARSAPVACIHPGAPVLVGREAVLQSWRQILRAEQAFSLRCDSATVQLLGSVALVLCYEGGEAEPAHLAATNVFVLEDGAWRMVHHHAGPLSAPIARPSSSALVN